MIAPLLLGAFLQVMVVAPVPTVTQTDAGRISLRGLKGLAISVEILGPVLRQGVTETGLEQRAARGLRLAGCAILDRADWRRSDPLPLLVLQLQTVRVPGKAAFAWHLSTAVHQPLWDLTCEDAQIFARTWAANESIGISSSSLLRSSIERSLDAQMEEFIRDWGRREEKD
jgi:hypothetical protein